VKVDRSLTMINLRSLRPTNGMAAKHSRRVYYQVQMWFNEDEDICYTDWGWERDHCKNLVLVTTDKPLIPDILLKKLYCGCKKGCSSSNCTCRKNGNTIFKYAYIGIMKVF